MNLPRLPLHAAPGAEKNTFSIMNSHFLQATLFNRVIERLEARLQLLPLVSDRWRVTDGVADLEAIMYATMNETRASPLDKLEAVLRFAFAYEWMVRGTVSDSRAYTSIGDEVLRELSLTL